MRAVWKGHIQFSLVTIPIRIYNAIETGESIRFRQLDKRDHAPIGYKKINKITGQEVKSDEIVKGFEYEKDQYVIIENDDLDKLKLKSTRIIEIEGFVDQKEVSPMLYDAPYFAGPDGDAAAKSYALLCKAMEESGKLGVGRVVLRDRESAMLISPKDGGLCLYKLRYPAELRKIQQVPKLPEQTDAEAEQLKLAHTLVDSMTKSFEDIELQDRYKNAVREIIDAKVAGQEIVAAAEEEKPVVDIMSALKASIDKAKDEKKPMKKAEGKKADQKAKKAS
jgi:DNA end-binding protein Ku